VGEEIGGHRKKSDREIKNKIEKHRETESKRIRRRERTERTKERKIDTWNKEKEEKEYEGERPDTGKSLRIMISSPCG
jgi:hypothetical protein